MWKNVGTAYVKLVGRGDIRERTAPPQHPWTLGVDRFPLAIWAK